MSSRILLLTVCLLVVFASDLEGAHPSSPDSLRIAGVVLKWIRADREANFARLEPLVREAAVHGADIVCTTECSLDGYAIDDKEIPLDEFRALGEPIPDGPYYHRFQALADELNINLIVGLLERDGDHLYNTAIMLNPAGELVGKYHKQELEHELVRVTPGNESTVMNSAFGKLGVMICADRRNRDVVQGFCDRGANLLICPSGGMFGPIKNDHILQKRSREMGKYIVFVHPAEFLVTAPDGNIVQRVLLGDKLKLDSDEVHTGEDSSGVFYCDLYWESGIWRPSLVSQALSKPSLPSDLAKQEVLDYLAERIPQMPKLRSQDEWMKQATELRERFLQDVVLRGEARAWRDANVQVEWLDEIRPADDYRIRKFRYEALPGFWIPALLYEPTQLTGRVPVMLNPNGHDREGKAASYKQLRCINLARRGLLAYSFEFINMGQLRDNTNNRHNRLVQLDLCGTSGVAPFHLSLVRGLEVALSHEHADPNRVGIAGLSGGGWQSIWLAALDTRIALANPVAGYCSIAERISQDNNIGDAEQLASDMCSVADFTHFTAMVAPRPLLLTYNAKDDCCFLPDLVLDRIASVGKDVYSLCGVPENFQIHINEEPGTHNFERDNREALYRFLQPHMLPNSSQGQLLDLLVADSEIKSAEELAVAMPADNLTLHGLAQQVSGTLPEDPAIPQAVAELETWCKSRRSLLRQTVQQQKFSATPVLIKSTTSDDIDVSEWRLRMDDHWTLPVADFQPKNATRTCVIISDWGSQTLSPKVSKHIADGERVLAVDLLGFGAADPTSSPDDKDDVICVMLATLGERPLGIQAAQLTAAINWLKSQSAGDPPQLIAVGPRSSMIALVTAALEPELTAGVSLSRAWSSLREAIDLNLRAEDAPELFCFGLLKHFDVPQLIALAHPQPVVFAE